MVTNTATKTVKKTSAPKKAVAKSAPSHPPYIEMITEALVSLKERTGSSHYAIAKHIEEEQKVRDLPPNFRKLLFNQLKKSVASGKLVMKKPTKKSAAAKPKAAVAKTKCTTTAAKTKASTTAAKKQKVTMKSPAKKVAPVKAKKPKSIKSPAKKATALKTVAMKKTNKK
uniref:H15 domain-containing protein n=1 Tax=Chenopodium quinoa TaxID=63459 RepID=A0A803M1D8_CHEQI